MSSRNKENMVKTFKQIEAEDTATFFNEEEAARPIIYVTQDGQEIPTNAIRQLGDMVNPGGFGGQAPRTAQYHVQVAGVPDPQPMELIYDGSEKWRVTDVLSGTEIDWTLRCELLGKVRG